MNEWMIYNPQASGLMLLGVLLLALSALGAFVDWRAGR